MTAIRVSLWDRRREGASFALVRLLELIEPKQQARSHARQLSGRYVVLVTSGGDTDATSTDDIETLIEKLRMILRDALAANVPAVHIDSMIGPELQDRLDELHARFLLERLAARICNVRPGIRR